MDEFSSYEFEQKAEKSVKEEKEESKFSKFLKRTILLVLLVYFVFPQYWKPIVYPFLYGAQRNVVQEISEQDTFEDIEAEPFYFERNGSTCNLIPKTKYSATGRIGIIDHYDGWWNKFFRGYSKKPDQKFYIDLVPQDIFFVIGKMAEPDIFEMFKFAHEERNGSVFCKGVKYRTSFLSSLSNNEEEWKKSRENYEKCNPYINSKEYNNYHPIPANENINAALSMLRHGDVVSLEGYLVDAEVDGKPYLETATRHSQSHPWARVGGMQSGWCFLLYTTKIVVNGVLYE